MDAISVCAEDVMRTFALILALSTLALLTSAGPAGAQSREITGQAGVLGEWELTATVTERVDNGIKQLVGPLSLKHVGVCTVDGPEEKTGELRLRISDSLAHVKGTLLIETTECTYSGSLDGAYNGFMSCPDRRAVPLTLSIR